MKFKVLDEAHSRAIQQKLFDLGYAWHGYDKTVLHEKASHLFADRLSITYEMNDDDYFSNYGHTEYFLHNGEFVTEMPAHPELPNIKIRVTPQSPAKDIVTALEALGYKIDSESILKDVEEDNTSWLFGNSNGLIGSLEKTDRSLDTDGYEERFLFQGRLVSEAYFKKPVTASKQYCQGCNVLNCTGCEEAVSKPPVPLGLKPKSTHDLLRMQEVVEAMQRYVAVGKKIPSEWLNELGYLNEWLKEGV